MSGSDRTIRSGNSSADSEDKTKHSQRGRRRIGKVPLPSNTEKIPGQDRSCVEQTKGESKIEEAEANAEEAKDEMVVESHQEESGNKNVDPQESDVLEKQKEEIQREDGHGHEVKDVQQRDSQGKAQKEMGHRPQEEPGMTYRKKPRLAEETFAAQNKVAKGDENKQEEINAPEENASTRRSHRNTANERKEANYVLEQIPPKQIIIEESAEGAHIMEANRRSQEANFNMESLQEAPTNIEIKLWILNDERNEIQQELLTEFEFFTAAPKFQSILMPKLNSIGGFAIHESTFNKRRICEIWERLQERQSPYLTDIRARRFDAAVLCLHYDVFDIYHLPNGIKRWEAIQALAKNINKFAKFLESLPISKATVPAMAEGYKVFVVGMHPLSVPAEWEVPDDPDGLLWMKYAEDCLQARLDKERVLLVRTWDSFEKLKKNGLDTSQTAAGLELQPLGARIVCGAIVSSLALQFGRRLKEVEGKSGSPWKVISPSKSREYSEPQKQESREEQQIGYSKPQYPHRTCEDVNLPPILDAEGNQISNPIGFLVKLSYRLERFYQEKDPERRKKNRLSARGVQILQTYAGPLGVPINWQLLRRYVATHPDLRANLASGGMQQQVPPKRPQYFHGAGWKPQIGREVPRETQELARPQPVLPQVAVKEVKHGPPEMKSTNRSQQQLLSRPVVGQASGVGNVVMPEQTKERSRSHSGEPTSTKAAEKEVRQEPINVQQSENMAAMGISPEKIMKLEQNQQNMANMIEGLVAIVQKQAEKIDVLEQMKQQFGSHLAESRVRQEMNDQRLHQVTRDIGRIEAGLNQASRSFNPGAQLMPGQQVAQPASLQASSAVEGPRPPIAPTWMLIALCVLMCISLVSPMSTPNRIYYDCGAGHSGFPLAMPHEIICELPEENTPFRREVGLWALRDEPVRWKAHRCTAQVREICTHTGILFSKGLVKNELKWAAISPQTCWDAIKRRAWRGKALVSISDKVAATNNTLVVSYKYCCYDHCVTSSNLLIEQGEIATFDGQLLATDLGVLPGVRPTDGVGVQEDGIVIWNATQIDVICPYVFKGNFMTTVAGHHLLIDRLQAAYSFTKNKAQIDKHHCLPKNAYEADQGGVIIDFKEYDFRNRTDQAIEVTDLQQTENDQNLHRTQRSANLDSKNEKFQYLFEKLLHQERQNFQTTWLHICALAQRQLNLVWAMIKVDPTLGVRTFLNRTDIHATVHGEVFMVTKCRPVQPTKIYYDYKIGNFCYQLLPMHDSKQLFFLVPGTTDLVQSSPKIPCTHRMHAIFKDDTGLWRTTRGQVHVTELSAAVVFKGHFNAPVFDSPALFHDQALGTLTTITTFRTHSYRLQMLEARLSLLVDYSAELSTNPEAVKALIEGTGHAIGTTIESVGHAIGHVIGSVAHGAGDLVNTLLQGPLQIVEYILVVLLVCVAVIAGLYFSFPIIKRWILNRMPSRHQQRVQQTNQIPDLEAPLDDERLQDPDASAGASTAQNLVIETQENPNTPPIDEIEVSEKPKGKIFHLWPPESLPMGSSAKVTDYWIQAAILQASSVSNFLSVVIFVALIVAVLVSHLCPELKLIYSQRYDPKFHAHWEPIPMGKQYVCGIGSSAFVHIKLNGWELDALFDTGSDITICPKATLAKLSKLPELFPVHNLRAVAVSGTLMPLRAYFYATIQMGSTKIEKRVFVSDTLNRDFVLGLDTMHHPMMRPLKIDPLAGTIVINGEVLPFGFEPGTEEVMIPVRAPEHVLIPARHEMLDIGAVTTMFDLPNVDQYMLQPKLPFVTATNLLVGRGLYSCQQVDKGLLPLALTNVTSSPVHIYKDQVIGFLSPVSLSVGESSNNSKQQASAMNATKGGSNLKGLNLSPSSLSENEKGLLQKLLERFVHLFAEDDLDLGRTSTVKHKIDTEDAQPIRQRAYRVPLSQRNTLLAHIEKMQVQGAIRPSQSPWSSPCILVPKKDGSMRFVIDFHRVNTVTKKDVFPLPLISDILDSLGSAAHFSTLDLASGYWQVELEEESKPKTAFTCFAGLFEFEVLPFGLSNAPACFQRLMQSVLSGLQGESCAVYLDDIIIYSKTFSDHLHDIEQVFLRLEQHGLKLKLKKCHFGATEVPYLGHLVSRNGLKPDPKKVDAVKRYPAPKNPKEVRQFLGLTSYYRRFIKSYACIAEPLYWLTKKAAKFLWTESCQSAFKALVDKIVSAPILIFPDFSKPFLLQTDASGIGIGAVLSQSGQDGLEHPVAFASRTLTRAERRYPPIDQECLAIYWAIQHFRPYLYGNQFMVETDHKPHEALMRSTNPNPRLEKWRSNLQQYNFEVRYKKGILNKNADSLSRAPLSPTGRATQTEPLLEFPQIWAMHFQSLVAGSIDMTFIKDAQHRDNDLLPMIVYLGTRILPADGKVAKYIIDRSDEFSLVNDILHYTGKYKTKQLQVHQTALVVVPRELQSQVLQDVHESICGGGHFGQQKTYEKLVTHYYWDGCLGDVKAWVKSCPRCAATKHPKQHIVAPLVPLPVTGPFDRLGVDCLGPFPKSINGNLHIVVFCDYFTKWVEAFAVPNITANVIARLLVRQVICRHGCPRQLLSDQGSNFLSHLVQACLDYMGVQKVNTTAWHPQTDGLVERWNRTILQCLRAYVSTDQRDWDEHLDCILFSYRVSEQSSTGYSPFFLQYGRDPVLPLDTVLRCPDRRYTDAPDYAVQVAQTLKANHHIVQQNIQEAQERQKEYYNRKIHVPPVQIGSKVRVHAKAVPKGKSKKLLAPYRDGPYRVVDQHGVNLKIVSILNPRKRPRWIHMNLAKLTDEVVFPGFRSTKEVDTEESSEEDAEVVEEGEAGRGGDRQAESEVKDSAPRPAPRRSSRLAARSEE